MRSWWFPLALVAGLSLPGGDVQAASGEGSARETALRPSARQGKTRHARRPARNARKKVDGHAVLESQLRKEPMPRPSGEVRLFDIARKESLELNIYLPDGSYDPAAVEQISHLFRCKRTADEREIEPRLMTVLSHVYDKFHKRIEVVSGYRNQVRTTSYHYQGSAVDIRVPGVPLAKLRKFLHSIDAGGMGVGLYPRVGFIHVDVRPPPSYRWVDYSRSDPDAPDRRPPRGWKKLRS